MFFKYRQANLYILIVFCFCALTSCTTVKFVQPYDEALITGIQDFYKITAKFTDEAKIKSPIKRPNKEDTSNTGHISNFNDDYDSLRIDTNLLVMRSMVNSVKIGELGQSMQDKVSEFIDDELPSACAGDTALLGDEFTSLTVKNFADLKCLVTNWKTQHENAPSKILTKADWVRRHKTLVNAVIAVQKAESFKQVEKEI